MRPGGGRLGYAPLLRGAALIDLGRADEAAKAYREYLDEVDDGAALRPVAQEGLGYALERKADLQGALTQFRRMSPPSSNGDRKGDAAQAFRDRALWHEARLLEKMGKKADAKQRYETLLEKFAASPLRDEVQGRLAALAE